jgi:hypothetical protein
VAMAVGSWCGDAAHALRALEFIRRTSRRPQRLPQDAGGSSPRLSFCVCWAAQHVAWTPRFKLLDTLCNPRTVHHQCRHRTAGNPAGSKSPAARCQLPPSCKNEGFAPQE